MARVIAEQGRLQPRLDDRMPNSFLVSDSIPLIRIVWILGLMSLFLQVWSVYLCCTPFSLPDKVSACNVFAR